MIHASPSLPDLCSRIRSSVLCPSGRGDSPGVTSSGRTPSPRFVPGRFGSQSPERQEAPMKCSSSAILRTLIGLQQRLFGRAHAMHIGDDIHAMLAATQQLQQGCRMENIVGRTAMHPHRGLVYPGVAVPVLPVATATRSPEVEQEMQHFYDISEQLEEFDDCTAVYREMVEDAMLVALRAKRKICSTEADHFQRPARANDLENARNAVHRELIPKLCDALELQEGGEAAGTEKRHMELRLSASRNAIAAQIELEARVQVPTVRKSGAVQNAERLLDVFSAVLVPLLPALELIPPDRRSPSEELVLQALGVASGRDLENIMTALDTAESGAILPENVMTDLDTAKSEATFRGDASASPRAAQTRPQPGGPTDENPDAGPAEAARKDSIMRVLSY